MASDQNHLPVDETGEDGTAAFSNDTGTSEEAGETGIRKIRETGQIIRLYITVSHIAFVIITPLLIFIVGGTWAVRRFGLPERLNLIFIAAGVISMLCSLGHYLMWMLRMHGTDKGKDDKYRKYKTDPKDFDY